MHVKSCVSIVIIIIIMNIIINIVAITIIIIIIVTIIITIVSITKFLMVIGSLPAYLSHRCLITGIRFEIL